MKTVAVVLEKPEQLALRQIDLAAAAKQAEKDRLAAEKAQARESQRQAEEPGMVESVVKSSAFKSMLRSAGTVIGREITRSIFGTSRRR